MKTLSIVGTAAMFLVGGGILVHGIPVVYDAIHHAGEVVQTIPLGNILGIITPSLLNAIVGVIAGGIVLLAVNLLTPVFRELRKTSS